MEPIGDIIRRVIRKEQKGRRRLIRIQTLVNECLEETGMVVKVTAVRKGTIFLSVCSQIDKSEIESFYQRRIVDYMNRKLSTTRFERVKVKVDKGG